MSAWPNRQHLWKNRQVKQKLKVVILVAVVAVAAAAAEEAGSGVYCIGQN